MVRNPSVLALKDAFSWKVKIIVDLVSGRGIFVHPHLQLHNLTTFSFQVLCLFCSLEFLHRSPCYRRLLSPRKPQRSWLESKLGREMVFGLCFQLWHDAIPWQSTFQWVLWHPKENMGKMVMCKGSWVNCRGDQIALLSNWLVTKLSKILLSKRSMCLKHEKYISISN